MVGLRGATRGFVERIRKAERIEEEREASGDGWHTEKKRHEQELEAALLRRL